MRDDRALKKANEAYWKFDRQKLEPSTMTVALAALIAIPFLAFSAAAAWVKRAISS